MSHGESGNVRASSSGARPLNIYWKSNIGRSEVAPQQQFAGCSICSLRQSCTQSYLTAAVRPSASLSDRRVDDVFDRAVDVKFNAVLNVSAFPASEHRSSLCLRLTRGHVVTVTRVSLGRKQSGPHSTVPTLKRPKF